MKLSDLYISENITIKDAIKKLDETARKILLITEDKKLKGVLTDGDIRRWILKNGSLSEKVRIIMNVNPLFVYEQEREKAKNIMKQRMIEAIPILNEKNEVVDIVFWNEEFEEKLNDIKEIKNPVVIMAGGKGTRLYPLTKILPKPLLPIGDTPIVERIINRFREYGFTRFYITIYYKKNMIKAYFNELNKDYTIEYIEEEKPLGTGGSLYLLKNKIKETFFVTNCDILIDGNYSDILKYHKENKNKITIIASLKSTKIPYGVIELAENGKIDRIIEKPEYDLLVNTGMYILEPETLNHVPKNKFYNITELINTYIEKGEKVGIYPVSEKSWLDMGQFKEMENMLERLGLK